MQLWPGLHAVPQLPQFAALVLRLAHTPAQSVVPAGQAHAPLSQMSAPPQTSAQKPQLFLSVRRSTQASPHLASPDPHVIEHVPELHTCPPMHMLPHAPQLPGDD
jgi:hypothetical protein